MFRILASGILAIFCAAAATKKPAETSQVMQKILGALSDVLPLSFDNRAFVEREKQDFILERLGTLATEATYLSEHVMKSRDPGFRYVAKSFENDLTEAYIHYKQKNFDEARFTLHHVTENCVSCHTKLPGASKAPGADGFFARIDKASLSPLDRAHFMIVSRHFNEALDLYEAEFRKAPEDYLLSKAMVDYVKVSLRVNSDLGRVERMLLEIVALPKLNPTRKAMVSNWLKQINEVKTDKLLQEPYFDNGKKLVLRARQVKAYPQNEQALIYYIAASTVLNRFVATGQKATPPKLSEAFLDIAICEDMITDSFWLSETENYLESAVRAAPRTYTAKEAYRMLEEKLGAAFSGSSGTDIPEDTAKHLRELRKLIL